MDGSNLFFLYSSSSPERAQLIKKHFYIVYCMWSTFNVIEFGVDAVAEDNGRVEGLLFLGYSWMNGVRLGLGFRMSFGGYDWQDCLKDYV